MAIRIAVVSDVHGSLGALEAVVSDIVKAAPDITVHGGDLAVNGARGDEVVTTIRELGWIGIVGNTDELLWTLDELPSRIEEMPRFEPVLRALYQHTGPATLELLSEENLDWLRSLPKQLRVEGVVVTHASPGDLWRAPLPSADDGELSSTYEPLGGEVVVYGHIHRPFVRRLPGLVVANSGSAGLSWDGDPRASYLIVDGDDVDVRRVEYDVEDDIRDLHASAYPLADWLTEMRRMASYVFPNIDS